MTDRPPTPEPAIRGLPRGAYTPWLTRVGAYLIDRFPFAIVLGAGWLVLQNSVDTVCLTEITQYDKNQICSASYSTAGWTVMWGAVLFGIGYLVWNFGYRQGATGSSIGKSVMKFKVVSQNTGQPVGFGRSVLRQVVHFVDAIICYLGYLFPLWDAERKTLADKIMSTVCLPLEHSVAEDGPE
jgi:uncharacterized RDD family membrane protein YckC